MGMLPEKNLVAAQCAIKWAQKFKLLTILLAFQEEKAGMDPNVLIINEEIFQSSIEFYFRNMNA
jgi:hypothetical protein